MGSNPIARSIFLQKIKGLKQGIRRDRRPHAECKPLVSTKKLLPSCAGEGLFVRISDAKGVKQVGNNRFRF